MNAQHSGLTNGAIAAALVGVIAWLSGLAHVTIPDPIQNDIMVLLAWGAGYLLNSDPALGSLAKDIATLKAQMAAAVAAPAPVATAAAPAGQAGFSTIGGVLALLALGVAGYAVAGCALIGGKPWTPTQIAYFELAAATAAEQTAYQIEQSPELAPGYAALIIAAGQSTSAAVQAQAMVLSDGGSTSAQIQAAGLSGLVPIINNLGKVLAGPPTKVTGAQVQVVALQGGLDALQNLPALIGVVAELNSGWTPTQADMDAETKVLVAATAQLTAATAKAPAHQ